MMKIANMLKIDRKQVLKSRHGICGRAVHPLPDRWKIAKLGLFKNFYQTH